MWVVTIFNNINDICMFEYTNREAAIAKIEGLENAILSYTNYQKSLIVYFKEKTKMPSTEINTLEGIFYH